MHYLLFTTTRCPRCPSFKEFVQKFVKIPGEILDENNPSFQNLASQYGVSTVPTFVVLKDEDPNAILQTNETSDIYSFINNHNV